MTFRDPRWLWSLLAIPFAMFFFVVRERIRQRLSRRFVAERLRGLFNGARPLRPWLLAAGLALAVFALAGPSRGFVTMPVTEHEANRVVVLDVSNSMLAQDFGASRLSVAKAMVRRLIDAWPGRVALVEFEMAPEVVSPLTSDNEAVIALLDSLQAGEVGEPGSDIGTAILDGMRLVEAEPGAKADIIVISDGEDQGKKLDDAIKRAKIRGVPISTILVGSGSGSSIPMPDGSELRDPSGQVIKTIPTAKTLQKIAQATGGTFFANPFGEHALDSLLVPRSTATSKQKSVRVPVDRYQWPLALAFAAIVLGSLANRGAE